MKEKPYGSHSFSLDNPPKITAWASVAGKKESEGPLAETFDITQSDPYFGQKSWELAEKHTQQMVLNKLAEKSGLDLHAFGLVLSGDLLNQCIGSSFSLRNTNIPHLGLYGACSTMAEALLIGSMTVASGYFDNVVAMTSSHFASSERQYRFPLGYGGQRTTTTQWTVTGAGAALISGAGDGPRITGCTVGTVTDLGIRDASNMGAAMAPAAAATIRTHLRDFGTVPDDYDLIVTGDLGKIGRELLIELLAAEGVSVDGKLADCGMMVFNPETQDVHAGGSGCGCSAITLCGKLLSDLDSGKYGRILFCGTGALLSPTSTQQGLPIPGICHAVVLERS